MMAKSSEITDRPTGGNNYSEPLQSGALEPVAYDSVHRQLSERTEQLAHVVNRLQSSNHQLEEELRERNLSEVELKAKVDDLQRALEAEKALGDFRARFITLASHEFRTPFSTILSSASLAGRYAEAGNAEKRDQHLEKIRASVLHLTEILHDFLTAMQLDEKKVLVKPEHFELCALVEDRIEAVKNLERPGLEVEFDKATCPLQVFSDKTMVVEIVHNLIANAARFSKASVHCTVRLEGENVIFEVFDKGIGIPKSEQRHIFERFFRGSNVNNLPGIGLGLHVSKRYTDLLGGTLSFESSENIGTSFRLRFPKNNVNN